MLPQDCQTYDHVCRGVAAVEAAEKAADEAVARSVPTDYAGLKNHIDSQPNFWDLESEADVVQ